MPVVALPGEGYRLAEGYYLPPIVFTPGEARALSMAIAMLRGISEPGPTTEAASGAMEKIRAVLPRPTVRQLEALEAIVNFYPMRMRSFHPDDDMLLHIQQAVLNRQVVHLRYHAQNSNEVTERDVEPVELQVLDRAWMLVAYCRLRDAPRAFRLDRVDAYEVKSETFAPREMTPDWPSAGPVNVVVRFDAEVVRWVREQQHFSFAGEGADESGATRNGDAVMAYHPRSFEAIESWLLSWSHRVEVLQPPELRERMASLARAIEARHATLAQGTRPKAVRG